MSDYTIVISPDQVQKMLNVLGIESNSPKAEQTVQEWVSICVDLVQEDILGERRPRSVTEITIRLLDRFYEAFLPKTMPSATDVYRRFNLPYGQSQYIARVLREDHRSAWRQYAREELRDALTNVQAKAIKAVENKDTDVPIDVRMHASSEVELKEIYSTLVEEDDSLLPPRRRSGYADEVTIGIPPQTVLEVIEKLSRK